MWALLGYLGVYCVANIYTIPTIIAKPKKNPISTGKTVTHGLLDEYSPNEDETYFDLNLEKGVFSKENICVSPTSCCDVLLLIKNLGLIWANI